MGTTVFHKWLDIISRLNGFLHGIEFDNQIRGKTKGDLIQVIGTTINVRRL
jgi:hypothetical protein